MIHLISHENSHLYRDEVKALHNARREVFIEELGWRLRTEDGLEIDEYDDERARNMVGFSASREVTMGLRFRPTDDRSMLVDHFSHALPAGVRPINDSYTWELSRGFCRERGVRRQHLRRKAACMIAPLELAYQAGMNRCVGFTDVRMLNFCYGVGWKLNLLGSPVDYGEGDAVAYEVEISRAAITHMREMWGLPQPPYVEIDALAPGEASPHEAAERLVRANPDLKKIAPADADVEQRPSRFASKAEKYYWDFELQPASANAGDVAEQQQHSGRKNG